MKPDWDPKPSERTYYRSRVDGQRAYLVHREGGEMLRLDRPMEELLRKMGDDGGAGPDWELDTRSHAMSMHQATKVAFLADKALAGVLGDPVEAKKEWLNLHERDRIEFMNNGPGDDGIRDRMFLAIMRTLEELTGG